MFAGTIELPGITIDDRSTPTDLENGLRGVISSFVGGLWAGYLGSFHVSFQIDSQNMSARSYTLGALSSVSIGFSKFTRNI